MRIHLFGAPGSGVTTLGKRLALDRGIPHFDVDDYHWYTSDPLPYKRRRNSDHRRKLLAADLEANESWVLTGSLCGWGDLFIPIFDRVLYVWAPADLRLSRIRAREQARYGSERLEPGGDLHGVYVKFLDWAAAYDQAGGHIRSRDAETRWLEALKCPTLRLESLADVDDLTGRIQGWLK